MISSDKDASSEAIKKADDYLQKDAEKMHIACGQDRTVINRGSRESTEHAQPGSVGPATDMGMSMHTVSFNGSSTSYH